MSSQGSLNLEETIEDRLEGRQHPERGQTGLILQVEEGGGELREGAPLEAGKREPGAPCGPQ